MEITRTTKGDSWLWLLLLILVIVVTILVYVFGVNVWAVQVLSACIGAVITIIATRLLLTSQSRIEEERRKAEDADKRKFEFYNAKLKVYSKFVSQMYQFLSDGKVEEQEILDLRTQIFGQVSFYATEDILKSINDELKGKYYTDTQQMQRTFANIASILQNDLRKDLDEDWPINKKSTYDLWDTFDGLLDKSQGEGVIQEAPSKTNTLSAETSTEDDASNSLNNCFWHFTMWEPDEQLKALREGIYELNLVEYDGIDWRTNLIKQIEKDDLVFLFRSGGWGYMGVYRARGWRIFEFGEDKTVETIHVFGEGEKTITDDATINEDLKRSDIYKSKKDGATLCSSIIVEPIAFSQDGIGNPGGVYRRTISRYDKGYGIKQLSRFMAIMNNDKVFDIQNGVKMGCNKELFQKILTTGNIKPAARDENGNWL